MSSQQTQPGFGQSSNVIAPADESKRPTGQWMPRPQPTAGCPPGLEYLTQLDQIVVRKQVDMVETTTGVKPQYRYAIFNSMGQQCYFATESSNICLRQMCGSIREFSLHITDNAGAEVFSIYRPFICCGYGSCCMCCFCQQRMFVSTPDGYSIGYLNTEPKCGAQAMIIFDESDTPVLNISGPCCVMDMCSNEFTVWNNGQEIGSVKKQWTGYFKEAHTNADNFGVSFSKSLDVKLKACLLAATFLIDFMFLEGRGK